MTDVTIAFLLPVVILLVSCNVRQSAEEYKLTVVQTIPDSVKEKYKEFVVETVKAASNNLTTGSYKDVAATIAQAEATANKLYQVDEVVLVRYSDKIYGSLHIRQKDFNEYEKQVFNQLYTTTQPTQE